MSDWKVYLVGGAVRDQLLGKEPEDKDYVVVGATPEIMEGMSMKLIGKDFPVYLNNLGEEYALARTEKSTGRGYQDFECSFSQDVTLEEDLGRRDLTINSMSICCETQKLVDPYNGALDLANKLLNPTTAAFKEDPVRVLRAARFNATFPDFTYSEVLQDYCDQMYVAGSLDYLTPERVWKELYKALCTKKPSMFFEKLRPYRLFSELNALWGIDQNPEHHPEVDCFVHTMLVVDHAAHFLGDPEIIFSCLMHDLGKAPSFKEYGNFHGHEETGLPLIGAFCKKWKVPNIYRDLSLLVCKYHTKIHGMFGRNNQGWTRPKSIMNLLQETNAFGKPERFEKILKACMADARGRGGNSVEITQFSEKPYPQYEYLMDCLNAAYSVDTKAISAKILTEGKKDGKFIGEQIRVARIDAIRSIQRKWKEQMK